MPEPVEIRSVDELQVRVYSSRVEMGRAAAQSVARSQAGSSRISAIFASAPSQSEFLSCLARQGEIAWHTVRAFQLDEYSGMPTEAPESFAMFLRRHLFDLVQPAEVCYMNGTAPASKECGRYEALLRQQKIDFVCLGIGENGHLAFNEPHQANFEDSDWVKLVELDEQSRRQQVNDGCFGALEQVPRTAMTVTIPGILAAGSIHCVVPGASKANAVHAMLNGPVSTDCPASILRCHPNAVLYLDEEAARYL